MAEEIKSKVDVVIVGGGSAGCVLASRLSEDPSLRVLLLEAGMDAADPEKYPDLANPYPGVAYSNPIYTWPGMKASYGHSGSNAPETKSARYEQARVLGGGSAINGIGANRGAPSDYNEWADMGLVGWGWEDCLPYFRKLERDLDCDGPLHGKEGPIPIQRRGSEISSPFVDAMVAANKALGVPFHPDQNGEWEDGMFEMAVNMDERKRRVSVAWGYLRPEVRQRPNLEIRTMTTVADLLFEEGRVRGVIAERGGVRDAIEAGRVILSAGALATPAMLMRAGIGPGAHLADCGIAVRQNLPGVGQNLMEHPSAGLVPFLKPSARRRGRPDYHIPIGYRFSSGLEGCPQGDMHMNFVTRAAWHPIGRQLGSIFFWVNKSYSRGQLMLDPRAPRGQPRIDFRMLSDRRDLDRLMGGFVRAVAIASDPRLGDVTHGIYAGGMSEIGKLFSKPSGVGKAATSLGAIGLDAIGRLREKVLPYMLAHFDDPQRLVSDRDALETYIKSTVGGVWHPSGTCRMGVPGDHMAVTGEDGAVRGVPGLHVCDASLMPTIPCANTNLPTIMIAENIADRLRRA